jgi:H+/Cl- antiporter ClcA
LAAILTLGTGNSLGPEGTSVEVGMLMSRFCIPSSVVDTETKTDTRARILRNRVLLCAGAAAGVAAGFNAPLAGVFFALEIVQQSLPPLTARTIDDTSTSSLSLTVPDQKVWFQQDKDNDFLSSGTGAITAVLLASVLSALVSQVFLGNHLALGVPSYQLNTPLIELPMYLLLGVLSALLLESLVCLPSCPKGSLTAKSDRPLFKRP